MKGDHIENLKKGDYIVIYDLMKDEDDDDDEVQYLSPFGSSPRKKTKPRWHGVPVEVQAIHYPFIVCHTLDSQTTTIDSRVYAVSKVNHRYVQAFTYGDETFHPSSISSPEKRRLTKKKRKKKEKPDAMDCPRCGHRMKQVLDLKRGWHLVCDQCNGSFDIGDKK